MKTIDVERLHLAKSMTELLAGGPMATWDLRSKFPDYWSSENRRRRFWHRLIDLRDSGLIERVEGKVRHIDDTRWRLATSKEEKGQ